MNQTYLNERKNDVGWPLLLAAAGLMVVGIAFVFSATAAYQTAHGLRWYKQMYLHQIIWDVLGVGVAVALCAIDYSSLARWSMVFYWITILMLLAVFFIGAEHNGAKRWINAGSSLSLQPSEFAKIAFILAQANFLSRPMEELRIPAVFFKALGLTLLPFVLILKEPDLGSAFVFLPVSLAMLFVAGVPNRWLARLVGGAGLLVVLLVTAALFAPSRFKIVEPYQKIGLLSYFGRDVAPLHASAEERQALEKWRRRKSYNVEQSLISVGSGGWFGKGWRQGTQSALGFLPRAGAHNDFIFSVIAEEAGFVGSVVVLTLYTVLLFSGIKVASQARDRLGQLLAIGVVTLLFCHVFINIGMNIRLMPVTGIPLPLISYGGSSVVCSLIAIGILHNIHVYRRSY
jgi:rod shape determining protein RodA